MQSKSGGFLGMQRFCLDILSQSVTFVAKSAIYYRRKWKVKSRPRNQSLDPNEIEIAFAHRELKLSKRERNLSIDYTEQSVTQCTNSWLFSYTSLLTPFPTRLLSRKWHGKEGNLGRVHFWSKSICALTQAQTCCCRWLRRRRAR